MELLFFIAAFVAFYWIYKFYGWIVYKNKYPILSSEIPNDILEVGDEVSFGKGKVHYLGIYNEGDIYYVFEREDSIDRQYLRINELKNRLDTVYGRYGIKWKRMLSTNS